MNFYLASSYTNKASMRSAKDVLEALGHEVTARWVDGQETIPLSDNAASCTESAIKDLQDINTADTFVVFTDKPSTTGGFFTEFGYAYGIRKKIVVIGPIRNIFMYLPNIIHFDDLSSFVISLGGGNLRHLSAVK